MEGANRFGMAVKKVMSEDEVHWLFVSEFYCCFWSDGQEWALRFSERQGITRDQLFATKTIIK